MKFFCNPQFLSNTHSRYVMFTVKKKGYLMFFSCSFVSRSGRTFFRLRIKTSGLYTLMVDAYGQTQV